MLPPPISVFQVTGSWGCLIFSALIALSTGCSLPTQATSDLSTTTPSTSDAFRDWKPYSLPTKRNTSFVLLQDHGRLAMMAVSKSSASMLRKNLRIEPEQLSGLQFSWRTDKLVDGADMADRYAEDAVVRVILTFEGDRGKFSAKNRMLSELSQTLTGEELPYATLMYVWCSQRQREDIIVNPRTDRIRKLVVEAGTENLGRWLDYERDIRKDFVRAFGEEPGALTGIAIMTDTDNTQGQATAWYGPAILTPRSK